MNKLSVTMGVIINLALLSASRPASADGLVVIANPSVSATSLTKDQVKQVFLANLTKWPAGKEIHIIALSPGTGAPDEITKEYMGMDSWKAKKYWLLKAYNGVLRESERPIFAHTTAKVVDLVARTPNAIAVIPSGAKLEKVKVIRENP